MANSPTDLPVHHFPSRDGLQMAYREMAPESGGGRPLVLIHGFVSNAMTNWVKYGHAARLVAKGYRVIMPDLRGHGDSAKPHDPAAYPHDVMADDGFALIEHLGLTDYDLGGYSLGGRTTVRMLARGGTPKRAIVCGMGLQGILHTADRGGYFQRVLSNLGTFERGSSEWMTEAFLKTTGADPQAMLLVLETFADTPRWDLAKMTMPILVLTGLEDQDNGTAAELADALPNGEYRAIPGNHMSAVARRELGETMAEWLGSPEQA